MPELRTQVVSVNLAAATILGGPIMTDQKLLERDRGFEVPPLEQQRFIEDPLGKMINEAITEEMKQRRTVLTSK